MQQECIGQLAAVERLGTAGDEHDREFQTLALMNRHNPHDIFLFPKRAGRSQVPSALLHPVHKPQKPEQAAKARRFVLLGTVVQRPQIRLTLFPAGQPSDEVEITGFPINIPDQIGKRPLQRLQPPRLQRLVEPLKLVPQRRTRYEHVVGGLRKTLLAFRAAASQVRFARSGWTLIAAPASIRRKPISRTACGLTSLPRFMRAACGFPADVSANRIEERSVAPSDPNMRELLFVQADERRPEHSGKRDILIRVVDDPKQRQHNLHFRRRKITGVQLRISRNPPQAQLLDQHRRPLPGRPQQHDDVTERNVAHRFRTFVIDLVLASAVRSHHRKNALCDVPPFQLGRLEFFRFRHRVASAAFGFLPFRIRVRRSACARLLTGIRRPVDQYQLGRTVAPVLRIGRAADELRSGVVVDLADALVHHLTENIVRPVDHLAPAAEVTR